MEYLLRTAEEKDLQRLVELCQQHAEYERAGYNAEGKEELLEKAIFGESPKLFCLVVESGNKLVGFTSYTFDFSTWDAGSFLYMDCLYLESAVRSLGIGQVIIEKLKDIAAQSNCINIQWQTPAFNERAITFYKRIGGVGKEKMRFSMQVGAMG